MPLKIATLNESWTEVSGGPWGTLLVCQLRRLPSNDGLFSRMVFPHRTAMLTPARDMLSIRATSAPLHSITPTAR